MLHRHLRFLPLLFCALFLFAGLTANAPAQTASPTPVATSAPNEAAAPKEEKLSLKPTPLLTIGEFSVTNSMLVTWIVAIAVIVFAQLSTHNIKQIPDGAQNFCEWIVESLYDFLASIIGNDLVKKTFWFFATIFIFILFTNWAGLIPGVGTVGWGHRAPSGIFEIDRPLFRGGNADLNMTTAMSAIFFVLWFVWALQANGVGGFLKHLFAPKGEMSGFFLRALMAVIFFLVGWLEVISILFRPVSLSFRLFGNIYAGEVMLESMSNIVPALSWLLPIPFYFMEILVGFVQALVFMLLTAVFTMLIASHETETAH